MKEHTLNKLFPLSLVKVALRSVFAEADLASYTEVIGALLQGASLLQGTGHCCLAGLLIRYRGRVSVTACPFAAP